MNLHPNGFWIILLKLFRNGSRLRLHYWPTGSRKLDTPHDHRATFISLPLWGVFEERRYAEAGGDAYDLVRCHATTSGNGRPLTTPLGKGNVRETWRGLRFPFVPYLCKPDVIHSLAPKTPGPALSLVYFRRSERAPRAWLTSPTIVGEAVSDVATAQEREDEEDERERAAWAEVSYERLVRWFANEESEKN